MATRYYYIPFPFYLVLKINSLLPNKREMERYTESKKKKNPASDIWKSFAFMDWFSLMAYQPLSYIKFQTTLVGEQLYNH